jgi:hypothetical protein
MYFNSYFDVKKYSRVFYRHSEGSKLFKAMLQDLDKLSPAATAIVFNLQEKDLNSLKVIIFTF